MSLTRPPYKQRRRSKKNGPLHEDDDDAIDTVTHVELEVNMKQGPRTKRIKVPLTVIMEEQGPSNSGIHENPDLAPDWVMQEPQVAEEPSWPHIGMVSF
jgi:hypothetical protein